MNPTAAELETLFSGVISGEISHTNPLSDSELDAVLNGIIGAVDNLDPDKPVKVKQIGRA